MIDVTLPKRPDPVQRAAPRRRRGHAAWLAPLLLVVLALAGWAFWFEPRRLVLHARTLDVPHWPEELRGTRIALLSDLHVGSPYWHLPELEQLVERVNRERPDLVLLAGDYQINGIPFGEWVDSESIARVLGRLEAPLGVVAVLGNHDWWNDGHRTRRAFESEGIVVLENQAHAVSRADDRFFIVGLADQLTRRLLLDPPLSQVPAGAPFIVLAHEPDVFRSVPERASLTLAGHTHGGQVRLPIVGRLVVPSRYGQAYAAGHVVENGRHLFVTTGVGTSIWPVRFGVPPEIALLTLE